MSTYAEATLKMKVGEAALRELAGAFEFELTTLAVNLDYLARGREVCAKRARKIRKRGDLVRYVGKTTTGKNRYRWMAAGLDVAFKW